MLIGATLLAAALVPVALARSSSASTAPLDAALRAARARIGAPGAEASIVACGQVVWAGADGVTDLRSRRRVTAATPFVIASSTKTVTATMVMQQVQAGRLSLSTRLSRFYPKISNARKITLRMLLNMTSGLSDYDDAELATQPQRHWTRNEVLDTLGDPQFPPGEREEYTNSNYTLLGGILEQVTRTPIETYFQRNIAQPAGMTSSTWTPSRAVIDQLAQPYERQDDGSLKSFWRKFGLPYYYYGPVFTDGGLVSTATDLARFGNALLRARLVNAATLKQMTYTPDGAYGLGIFARSFDGHRWLGHNGSFGGYESEDFTDPKRQVTITVVTNMGRASEDDTGVAEGIWNAVVKAYDRSRPATCG